MKKYLLLLTVILCVVALAACGGETSQNNDVSNDAVIGGADQPESVVVKSPEELIIGSWKGMEQDIEVTYTFKSNGKFSCDYCSGSYDIAGNKITLTADIGGTKMDIFSAAEFNVTSDTLSMSPYTYTRQ